MSVEAVVALLAEVEIQPDREEVEILLAGGVTVEDFDVAIDRWGQSYRVMEDWGFIRTVALARRADVLRIQREAAA